MIYLDSAATSWPKPPEVIQAMSDYLERAGGSPGRSGHRLSIAAARVVYQARELAAELFNAPDPLRVILTSNATHSINIALRGLLKPGDAVAATGVEHNAVMRPLRALEADGVRLTVLPCRPDGSLDMDQARPSLRPGTKLVVATHANNVTGTILPIAEVAAMARDAGALLLVDAAQTAGVVPLDMRALGIDLLAFTGHKGLLGPSGTGGLIIGDRVDCAGIEPLMRGGTGSRSEFEEQPEVLPDKFESGTLNGVGIAGLRAGIDYVMKRGVGAVREHEKALTKMLLEGLSSIPGVMVYGPGDPDGCTAVVSFRIADQRVSETGLRLDEEYGVLSRVGLHCAPAVHRTIGTLPEGTVRFAPGAFTTMGDIEAAVEAVRSIAR